MVYEYYCIACGYVWEEGRRMSNRDIPTVLPCPRCQEYEVKRSIGSSSFILKGRGWAEDGYSNNPAQIVKTQQEKGYK